MRSAVEKDAAATDPADPADPAPGPRLTDADGHASFLDAVRTLVHGENIATQRPDSDAWAPAPDGPGEAVADPPIGTEDAGEQHVTDAPADWLPGRWVAEPAVPQPRSGRTARAATGPESVSKSARKPRKSAKSNRKRRPGRTVEEAAQEGVPGAEVHVTGSSHAPETATPEPAEARSRPDAEPAPEPGPSAKTEREAAQAQARADRLARRAAKAQAKIDRRSRKAQAKVDRVAAAARSALAGRAVAATAARAAAEHEAEKEQRRADRVADDALADVARAKARSDAAAERAEAKAEARTSRAATRAQATRDRAATKARSRLERAAAKAQRRVDRATARAQVKAERASARAREEAEVGVRFAAADASAAPASRDESLADYLARVEGGRLGRAGSRTTRTLRVVVVTALVAVCAALPWTVPAVPGLFADLVPGHRVARVQDPPVEPSTRSFTGPVGISPQADPLAGVRLRAAGHPREVTVPRLHVDSEVVPISGQSGSLLPPSDPQLLGWWQEGQPAGAQYGSAVVTGHTVHTGGGALDHLDKLVVGDSVRVRTDAGWIRYVVQRTHIYSTAELARDASQIFTRGGVGRLVLITCDNWNGSFYESNAVVFAAPVADLPS